MVGVCANPACSAPFHNVHRGKLFLLDTREKPSTTEPPMFTPVCRKVQYVWLCELCARTMRVVSNEDGDICIESLRELAA